MQISDFISSQQTKQIESADKSKRNARQSSFEESSTDTVSISDEAMAAYHNSLSSSSQSSAFDYKDPDTPEKEEASFGRKLDSSEDENPLLAALKDMIKGKDPDDEKLTEEERERRAKEKALAKMNEASQKPGQKDVVQESANMAKTIPVQAVAKSTQIGSESAQTAQTTQSSPAAQVELQKLLTETSATTTSHKDNQRERR